MYPSSSRELIVHASVLAAVLWTGVLADIVGPGDLGRYSRLPKGNDFLQFYVAGTLAAHGRFDVLVDDAQFRAAQRPFLGPASPVSYPPVYPPQVGILFSPFSLLPYTIAYFSWAVLTLLLVGGSLLEFDACASVLRRHRTAAIAVVLAFPPLAYLILAGQVSAVSLASIAVLHRGSRRGSAWLAGAGIGLLGFKVSLFAPALAVSLLAREWRISAAAAAVAVMQTLAVAPITGVDVILQSFQNIVAAARHPDALVMRPYLTVSWRTFWTELLAARLALVAYVVTAAGTIVISAAVWRRISDALARVAILALAIVLAAPHLFVYDLIILAPAFLWAARKLLESRDSGLSAATVGAFIFPVTLPLVAWTHLQWGTLVLAVWWLMLVLTTTAPAAPETRGAAENIA